MSQNIGDCTVKEIRFHGRGWQDVGVTVQMIAATFGSDGKHAGGLPFFGVERRGAQVAAFVRVDDKPIREKTRFYFPDCLVLFDASQRSIK